MSSSPHPSLVLQPEEEVLSTLNRDGSRRWLRPRLSAGAFLTARRIVAWGLIVLFAAVPNIYINGRPLILLDVRHREFTFFGTTFFPTETYLLALLLISLVLGIFLFTALLGRVWCGWACPQTVYLEFLYRPIERLFEGTAGKGGAPRKRSGIRALAKYAVFLVASAFLANVFLSYFVGVEELQRWVRRSPLEHPASFLVMLVTTGLMMFNFCYFREQTCLVACPYGRLQSVLLDRDSLIISYDEKRGEPRGRVASSELRVTSESKRQGASEDTHAAGAGLNSLLATRNSELPPGDCIDCNLCVVTCPTGIDIRKGLQMECVGCAQCIDACDFVMSKIDRPRGLIRYTSQAALSAARPRIIRGRTAFYVVLLLILVPLLSTLLLTRAPTSVQLIRGVGLPYNVMPDGSISNQMRVKITNRTRQDREYTLEVRGVDGARLSLARSPIPVPAGKSVTENVLVTSPRAVFEHGHAHAMIVVSDGQGFETAQRHELLGPGLSIVPGN
ncbi:MAG: cytochrome c oxidase accessory protein CcoG [Phycisphaerae bacterium]